MKTLIKRLAAKTTNNNATKTSLKKKVSKAKINSFYLSLLTAVLE